MDIVSISNHKRLRNAAAVARVNQRMADAVLNNQPISIGGRVWLRCKVFHISTGLFREGDGTNTHQHGETQIQIPLAGRFTFRLASDDCVIGPGDALIIPSRTPHSWRTEREGFLIGILLSTKDGSGKETSLQLVKDRKRMVSRSQALTFHLREMVDWVAPAKTSAFAPAMTSSLLTIIITEILASVCHFPERETGESNGVKRARAIYEQTRSYIAYNLCNALKADELSQQAGITFRQLSRIFHQYGGESPHQCVLHFRLIRAEDMIRKDPLLAIKKVAYECGFSSPSHFSMAFKKHWQLSPIAFAQRCLAEQVEATDPKAGKPQKGLMYVK